MGSLQEGRSILNVTSDLFRTDVCPKKIIYGVYHNLKTNEIYNEDSSDFMADDISNTPIPKDDQKVGFGKHAELTFKTLAETQRGYVQWLFRQSWFQSKYPELYEYMDILGLRPSASVFHHDVSTVDSDHVIPVDHNSFQARFTDDNELFYIVQAILGENYKYNITNVTFEHLCNADIVVDVERRTNDHGWLFPVVQYFTLILELKPSVSNDYPEILRQMRAQRRSYGYLTNKTSHIIQQALITCSYTGDVDIEAVKKIFGDIPIIEVSPISEKEGVKKLTPVNVISV